MTAVACTTATGSRALGVGGDVITFAGRPRTGVWIHNADTSNTLWATVSDTPPVAGVVESTEIPPGAIIMKTLPARTNVTLAINGTSGNVYTAELN